MNILFKTIADRIDLTPGRYAAFGAAVGGLFGLMIVNVFGGAGVDLAPWGPGLSVLKVAVVVVVLLQAAGALVAWTSGGHRARLR